MRVTIPGASRSGSLVIPPPDPAILGFKSDGLIGLFTLDEGESEGPFINRADASTPGALYGNSSWVPPSTVAKGLRANDLNGFVIDTGISAARTAFTAVVCAYAFSTAADADDDIVGLEHYVFGTTTGVHNQPTGAHTATETAIGFSVTHRLVMFRDPNLWVTDVNRWYLAEGAGGFGQPIIMALSVDGPNEIVKLSTLADRTGKTRTDADGGDIAGSFDGSQTGNFAIGAWTNGLVRPETAPYIDLYAAAIYDSALDASDTAYAMEAMARLLVPRGIVAFAG